MKEKMNMPVVRVGVSVLLSMGFCHVVSNASEWITPIYANDEVEEVKEVEEKVEEVTSSESTPTETEETSESVQPKTELVEVEVPESEDVTELMKQDTQEFVAPIVDKVEGEHNAESVFVIVDDTHPEQVQELMKVYDQLPSSLKKLTTNVYINDFGNNGVLGSTSSARNVKLNTHYWPNQTQAQINDVLFHELGHVLDFASLNKETSYLEQSIDPVWYSYSRDQGAQEILNEYYPKGARYEAFASMVGQHLRHIAQGTVSLDNRIDVYALNAFKGLEGFTLYQEVEVPTYNAMAMSAPTLLPQMNLDDIQAKEDVPASNRIQAKEDVPVSNRILAKEDVPTSNRIETKLPTRVPQLKQVLLLPEEVEVQMVADEVVFEEKEHIEAVVKQQLEVEEIKEVKFIAPNTQNETIQTSVVSTPYVSTMFASMVGWCVSISLLRKRSSNEQ